jgi:tripartite-type tricarboxylate transporter receptor subunit TctC
MLKPTAVRGSPEGNMRRHCLLALALLVFGLGGEGRAQTWPSRQPIRLIVPFTAGSAIDVMARLVFTSVSKQIGQAMVVENRLGAGGTIGMASVAKAEPDGYTFLVNSSVHTITPSTYTKLPYDTVRDFAAVIPLFQTPQVLSVSPAKFKTIQDLVAAGKAKPGALSYGSGGVGGSAHLNAERFRLSAGFEALHVPFPGAPEALREVIAERIDFYFAPLAAALPLIQQGQVRALGVSTLKRSAALPDVATTVEAGYPNSDYTFWGGVFAPAGTPREIVQRLHDETAKVIEMPDIKDRMTKLGAEPMPMTPVEFDAYVRGEIDTLAAVVKAAGIQPN